MENKQKALNKLRNYISEGKSYAEATSLLKSEGFLQTDINDATFAFRAGKDKVVENEELANTIVSVESQKAKNAEVNQRNGGVHYRFLGGGLPYISNKAELPLWAYGLGLVIAIVAMVYLTK